MEILTAIFAFFIAIIILVTVHEFGHYWVAKKCGVSVLNFAIGFGPTLYSWQKNETTYHIKAIPLGGFVDMLDGKKHTLDAQQEQFAFNKKNVYQRFAIVLAGPLANILLAIVLYTGVFISGTEDIKPVVKTVAPNSFAQRIGLQPGDTFLKINNRQTHGIQDVLENFISNQKKITIMVNHANLGVRTLVLTLPDDWLDQPKNSLADVLGFSFDYPTIIAIIGQILPNSPAQKYGLQVGDQIIAINKHSIKTWREMVKVISESQTDKSKIEALRIELIRQNKKINLVIVPEIKNGQTKIGIGALIPKDFYQKNTILVNYSPIDAFGQALRKTYQISTLNLTMIKRILFGYASIKHINGPIGVAHYAGRSLELSIQIFIGFLALMSIAIAIFNLLPIPLLDGGHLFFYLIEMIKRSPVSDKIQNYFNQVGLLFIVLLLSIALYNDTIRFIN